MIYPNFYFTTNFMLQSNHCAKEKTTNILTCIDLPSKGYALPGAGHKQFSGYPKGKKFSTGKDKKTICNQVLSTSFVNFEKRIKQMLKNIPTFKMPTNYLPANVFPASSKS